MFHGEGKLYYENGKIKYEGNFIKDKIENGRFTDRSGNYYIGTFENWIPTEEGTW